MVEFITNKTDIAHLITTMRARYQIWTIEDHPSKLKALSIEGTVAGAIQEVDGVCIVGVK